MAEKREAEEIAELVAEKLSAKVGSCGFTQSEREAIKDLIRTKRNAVRAFFWIFGALVLWVVKDIYVYMASHLTLK